MSIKSQSANMKTLASLLSRDLGYIYGEKESGLNGAKKQFLSKGRAFLSALGKDLGFTKQTVSVNKAGIAVSGEVDLLGMWSENNGLYITLEQMPFGNNCIYYRTIRNLQDYTGGRNNYVSIDFIKAGDYESLVSQMMQLKENANDRREAA